MQSNVIFGFIFIAYLFFITARGELPTYLTILRGGGAQPATANGSTSLNSSSIMSTFQNAVTPSSSSSNNEEIISGDDIEGDATNLAVPGIEDDF